MGFKEGDRVAVDPWIGDGTCHYCRIGEEQLCEHPIKIGENVDGGFAEYVLIPHYRYLYRLRNLNPVEASPLPCAGLTPYRALVRKAQVKPSEYVVVVGAGGGLGTMAVQIAKVMGAVMTPSPPLKVGFHSGGLDSYPAYCGVTGYLGSAGFYKPISVRPT